MARRDRAPDRGITEMKYGGREFKSINTCRDCPDKHPGCHDHCEKYQSALAEWKEKKAAVKHAKRLYKQYDDFRVESLARFRK